MGCYDSFRVVGWRIGLDAAIGCVYLRPGVHFLIVCIRQLVTPADTIRDICQCRAVLALIFSIVRLRTIVAPHRLPACCLDDVVQLAVQEHAATLLCTPATSQRHAVILDACILGHSTLVENESQPYLSSGISCGIHGNVLWCCDIASSHAVQRTTFEPTGTASIDKVGSTLYDTLLIVASRLLLGAMRVLIARYLAAIEGLPVTIHMQGQCLTCSLATCVLDA